MNHGAKKAGHERSQSSTARKSIRRERILLEFPSTLLQRADHAAEEMNANRSELVRTAVEELLDRRDRERLEAELAEAYTANAAMNLELAKEFKHVDEEGF